MSKLKRGFTLIELLIVVAIIAILAAIAVPNFLEAQVRSKVSRVKADQRTYATAMEAYMVDWNDYPPFLNVTLSPLTVQILALELVPAYLSTPVSYLSDAMPLEPFNSKQGAALYKGYDILSSGGQAPPDKATRQPIYGIAVLPSTSVTDNPIVRAVVTSFANPPLTALGYPPLSTQLYDQIVRRRWYCVSPGPDTFYEFDRCMRQGGGSEINCAIAQIGFAAVAEFGGIYDPTNGTVSAGELVRSAEGIFAQ